MADQSIQYPELTEDLKAGLSWRTLKYFGAGAIIASVTIGSGETFFASRGGAIFGYTLMWCFVLSAILKGIQVYTAARHFTLTGEHPVTHWGQFPGPRNWVPWTVGIVSVLCYPFWLAGLPMFIGKTINWIIGITGNEAELLFYARLWGTLCILLAVTLTWLQSYGVLEKVQTFLVGLLLLSIVAACFAAKPDWLAALAGTFVPKVPDYAPWVKDAYPKVAEIPVWIAIGTFLGAIGGGTYDYIGYLGCFREKKWGLIQSRDGSKDSGMLPIDESPENIRRGKRWLLPAKIDVGVGFFCVLLFTICFLALGAAMLHPQEVIPDSAEPLKHQAEFVTQFHPAMKYFYQLGIFMAFWGTIYGAYEIYIRTAEECFRPISRRVREMPKGKFRLIVLVYCAGGALPLLWLMDDPVKIVTPAAIIGGVLMCGLWCFLMIWTDRHFLPKPLRMGRTLFALTVVSGTVLTVLGLKAVWDYAAGLF
ncbi:MAG: Nramp family divalent metal transporter [Pirellulales bacterium]